MISKSRNKIHRTLTINFNRSLYMNLFTVTLFEFCHRTMSSSRSRRSRPSLDKWSLTQLIMICFYNQIAFHVQSYLTQPLVSSYLDLTLLNLCRPGVRGVPGAVAGLLPRRGQLHLHALRQLRRQRPPPRHRPLRVHRRRLLLRTQKVNFM